MTQAESKRFKILRQRAEQIARRTETPHKEGETLQITIVGVGREKFGIETTGLDFVAKLPPIARLPSTPPWIDGIAVLRGDIVAIVQLCRWFGIKGNQGSLVIVVTHAGRKLGLRVDSMLGFTEVRTEGTARSFLSGGNETHLIRAVTKDSIAILDLKQLMDLDAIQVGTSRPGILESPPQIGK